MGCLHLESLHLGYNQISPAMYKMLSAAADRYHLKHARSKRVFMSVAEHETCVAQHNISDARHDNSVIKHDMSVAKHDISVV